MCVVWDWIPKNHFDGGKFHLHINHIWGRDLCPTLTKFSVIVHLIILVLSKPILRSPSTLLVFILMFFFYSNAEFSLDFPSIGRGRVDVLLVLLFDSITRRTVIYYYIIYLLYYSVKLYVHSCYSVTVLYYVITFYVYFICAHDDFHLW